MKSRQREGKISLCPSQVMFCAPDSLLPLPKMMHQDDINFANIRLVHRAEKHRFSWPNTPCMDQTREQQMDEPLVLSTKQKAQAFCQLVVPNPDPLVGEQKAQQTPLDPSLSKPPISPYKL